MAHLLAFGDPKKGGAMLTRVVRSATLVLAGLIAVASVGPQTDLASAGPIRSDQLLIQAIIDESFEANVGSALLSFSGTFVDVPALKSGDVFLTEAGSPNKASDRVSLVVNRPVRGEMLISLNFTSFSETLPDAGPNKIPETGAPQNLNSAEFQAFFGAALPFRASVQSGGESDGSSSDVMRISSFIDESLEVSTLTFGGDFPDVPALKSADVYLTEPGAPTKASDLIRLTVNRFMVGQMSVMSVTLSFTSFGESLPDAGPNKIPETESLQNLNGADFRAFFGAELPFRASVESRDVVPQPGTLVLLGAGMLTAMSKVLVTLRGRKG
jgi:hypothetical protein